MSIVRRPGVCIGALAIWAALLVAPVAAQSVPLFAAQLSGANIDALFGQDNSPEATETEIPLQGINGKAILQSRVIRAAPGSRAAGRFAYEYRIDLSQATTFVDASCLTNLSVKFGPIEKLPYAAGAPGVALRDVYAIKQGVPANQLGFSSAVQTGDLVTFTFEQPVCASDGRTPGDTTFAFGLASRDAPDRGVNVVIYAPGLEDMRVKSFGPIR
jgi:hypothetical protein